MLEWTHRVLFQETDGMRVVYHGNYLNWLEAARVEYLRTAGITLNDLMAAGIVFPIVDIHMRYMASAHYDDLVTVKTYLIYIDRAKILFAYDVVRKADDTLLAKGESTGTFTSMETGRIMRIPKDFIVDLAEMSKKDKEAYHG